MNIDVEPKDLTLKIIEEAESEVEETTKHITLAVDSAAVANKRRLGIDRSVIAWSIIATYAVAVITMPRTASELPLVMLWTAPLRHRDVSNRALLFRHRDFRYWHLADIGPTGFDFRFRGLNGR